MKKSAFLLLGAVCAFVTSVRAGAPGADSKAELPVIPDEAWGSPILGGGVKSNGNYTEGSLFSTDPLWDSIGKGGVMGGSLLFVEPYATWGEGGDVGGSLGLGFRHLFSHQTTQDAHTNRSPGFLTEGVYVGANFFLDYDHTQLGSDFWQTGVGAEVGTRYLELRGNYYIPVSNEHFLGSQTDVSRSTSRRSFTSTRLGPPFVDANGNTLQNRFQTNFNTSRTTTVKRVTEFWEEPLEGWDVELSALVPRLDRWMDVRLVGAYFSYQGDYLHTVNISGWRAGMEVRPVKAVVLSAMWYGKNQLYREHWLAGIRLEIPLGRPAKDSFTSGYRPLADRLYEPVRRKNGAVTSSAVSNTTTTTSTTGSSSSTTSTSQILLATPPLLAEPD